MLRSIGSNVVRELVDTFLKPTRQERLAAIAPLGRDFDTGEPDETFIWGLGCRTFARDRDDKRGQLLDPPCVIEVLIHRLKGAELPNGRRCNRALRKYLTRHLQLHSLSDRTGRLLRHNELLITELASAPVAIGAMSATATTGSPIAGHPFLAPGSPIEAHLRGAIACFGKKSDDDAIHAVSVMHLLDDQIPPGGQRIYHPAGAGGRIVGDVALAVPIAFSASNAPCDAMAIKLAPAEAARATTRVLAQPAGAILGGPAAAALDARVSKYGPATGLTTGVVDRDGYTLMLSAPRRTGPPIVVATLDSMYAVRDVRGGSYSFADDADSGSPVFADENAAVRTLHGILVARGKNTGGHCQYSYFQDATTVLGSLGLRFI